MGSQMDAKPSNIRIDRKTGRVRLDSPIMNYDFSSKALGFASNMLVPYRLTPGITDFLGISHVKGSFLSVLHAVYRQYIESQDFTIFFSFAGYLDFISAARCNLVKENSLSKIKTCTQTYIQQLKQKSASLSLQQVLSSFLTQSIDCKNRASMETTWCMWL